MTNPSPPRILCTVIKNSDGVLVKCEVLEHGIPDMQSVFPAMLIRGIDERLNPINRVVVPMTNLFMEKVTG